MAAESDPAGPPHRVFHVSETWHPVPARPANADSVVEMLTRHLTAEAKERTIREVVAGERFCAVVLDDGGVGMANLCPDVCGKPSRVITRPLTTPGSSAVEALATLAPPARSAVGLATANALANRPHPQGARRDTEIAEGDLLAVLDLHPDDQVGMVGCFSPLVEPIRRRVGRLLIFERGQRRAPELLSDEHACGLLPRCSVAILTATTLLNGTIDALLAATADCREVVLLGPSTPLLPEVFTRLPRRVTWLSGMLVNNVEKLVRTVAEGGSTRDFSSSVIKVNVRVREVGSARPEG
ncbi:MAG: DUF364 domain-containing protein [Phycisphaerae bacterium]|nr:DUF364 domain-containing protein [Phycisphaerae bacterium]